MMNVTEIKKSHANVCQALAKKNIKESLDLIRAMVVESQNGDLIDDHYNIEFTYKNILKYTVEGISDPERQKIYNHLVRDVYRLGDKVADVLLSKFSSDVVFEHRKKYQAKNMTELIDEINSIWSGIDLKKVVDSQAENSVELQSKIVDLFNYVWGKVHIDNDDKKLISDLMFKSGIPVHYKAVLVGGINLSLMSAFSYDYLQLLIELCKHPDDAIAGRAMAALLLALDKYDARLPLYPELYTQLFMMIEEGSYQSLVQSIAIQLIRTRETERISQKMNEEILPEVVKLHPKLSDKLDLDNLISDSLAEGKNPDWEDVFKDSPNLMNKMEELTQWQMEGADVFLSTFKHLKHFSFFNETANWLLPFYPTQPQVLEALHSEDKVFSSESLLDGLSASRFLCNSDKYSLILSIPHMPGMQKEMMGQMFSAEIEQMMEMQKDEQALQGNHKKLVASNQFIQDLYRLLKVHPQKHQFNDVFVRKMDFHKRWFFNQLFDDTNSLREIGEYYFKKNYFEDALEIMEIVRSKSPEATDVIQKIAFCHQQLKNYDEALKYYLQADLVGAQSVWNKKKIALCYRHLKKTKKALGYYQEAEKVSPDNLHTQVSIGHCLLELNDFEQALKYYFKVEYLDPGNNKVGRPIAWCSFVVGNFDQAEKYYHKLIVSEKNKHDLINIGHTLWCKKQRKEALSYYQMSIQLPDHSLQEFIDTFNDDIPHLKRHGIDSGDIPLMLDQIRYSLEN
ncbi:lipopolysaccharide assembly protein LapB [Carboxylicivirga sp. M1479]|uniref:tetratricopeptide repeat protein n=1 Tax=Carboxylicivirga sp. M1479 TaxID=2594476 RepID=UPI0011779E08|nr:tetratricopeptide repeat protein [Carboxylicivirga sp. M1479]TRX65781.1 tetratricopeptide repeat protein [Carboxylicivirga sp. M1479]